MTTQELVDAIDAVIYADVFDSAVTLEEARRYARVALADAETLTRDERLRPLLVEQGGVIALSPRTELLAERNDVSHRATILAQRARRVARVLRHTPFVRGIALTGSVAAGNAHPDADVDLLVIVADGRIGTVFLFLGSASRVLGRRCFCPNLYLAETHIAIEPSSRYVERELAQAQMLVGPPGTLRDANPWLDAVFPNLPDGGPTLGGGGRVQRAFERILGGSAGRRLEGRARVIAAGRLANHYVGQVPEEIAARLASGEGLRFHRGGLEERIPARYAGRRSEIEAALSSPTAARNV